MGGLQTLATSVIDGLDRLNKPYSPGFPLDSSDTMLKWIERFIADKQSNLKSDEEELIVTCVLPDGRELEAVWFGYAGLYLFHVQCLDRSGNAADVLIHPYSLCLTSKVVSKDKARTRPPIGFQPVATTTPEEAKGKT